MQRVDEKTYIHSDLVTCAAYQRFIDAMLAQGKRFQPDHWTSYQYPEEQACWPVLGVRPSDAMDFCQWLTINDPEKWRYRLPTRGEAERYPILMSAPAPHGYWITDSEEDTPYGFVWIGTAPPEARILDLPHDYSRTPDRNFGLAFKFATSLFNDIGSQMFRSSFLRNYIDLMELYERSVGHTPACEGIRLVQEERSGSGEL